MNKKRLSGPNYDEAQFHESKKAVAGDPSKPSRWVYAGLPVLIAGVESFLIEHENLLARQLRASKHLPISKSFR